MSKITILSLSLTLSLSLSHSLSLSFIYVCVCAWMYVPLYICSFLVFIYILCQYYMVYFWHRLDKCTRYFRPVVWRQFLFSWRILVIPPSSPVCESGYTPQGEKALLSLPKSTSLTFHILVALILSVLVDIPGSPWLYVLHHHALYLYKCQNK